MSHPKYKHTGDSDTKVIEECSELIKEICKAQRFGWFNHHPDFPGKTNIERIKEEMDDVVESIEALEIFFRHLNFNEKILTNYRIIKEG